ncbi:MAG: hypothetical protein A2X13_00845 [Bacteroidetes bacterium GWC2_33_15]|nr:MAG: hypothetical protein A2X10_04660 [Bacteroidetes bacterium GWA2_33_15]OFX51164.1 MAG: hypothetical protein A2X13_00845 [Bacteroidetes bacterium GWC2_33_15]OFX66403.1 MAG: hypothetical protein A2X15_07110 [Bacteroidetes bacterium GWB2_32_14]OFX70372.1 MAG: hypothetical protein A2X14_03735 [Bacteroidetes bacterium GWD2_33_33]HAN17378.1 hypothetical protein [Bacteroidales bacterium]
METKATKRTVTKTATGKKTVSTPKKSKPTDEEIQARAYEIYVESGYQGTDLENWIKAEKELLSKK